MVSAPNGMARATRVVNLEAVPYQGSSLALEHTVGQHNR